MCGDEALVVAELAFTERPTIHLLIPQPAATVACDSIGRGTRYHLHSRSRPLGLEMIGPLEMQEALFVASTEAADG